jgi:hypothetical protein
MTFDRFSAFLLRYTPGFGPGSARAIAKAAAAIGAGAASALSSRPTAHDVISAFRLILGRDPAEEQIQAFMRLPTVTAVRRELIASQEFKDWFTREHLVPREHPDVDRSRPTLFYIHLPKTGGTSLRHALAQHFQPDRICPVQWNKLHLLPVAELGHYDFYQGHFDHSSLRLVPRDDIRVISMFREPRERLISAWRSLRAAPWPVEPGVEPNLAQRLDIEEFYEFSGVRLISDFHNYYLMVFGFAPSWIGSTFPPGLSHSDRAARMDTARRNIRGLTAFGLTERFDQSVKLIYKVLGARPPESVTALNVTDAKPSYDPRFRKVEPVTVTPRLQAALDELVEFDEELYRFAVEDFERRCALHGIA